MEIPTVDFNALQGENRKNTMSLLNEACEKWGFFQIENHGVDKELMEKLKHLVKSHYDENLKGSFYESEIVKNLKSQDYLKDTDWESSYFVWHRPESNIGEIPTLSEELRITMDDYVSQVIKVAEKLADLMCENLGLEKGYIKKAFSFSFDRSPSIGTKVALYPQCPEPERVRGLREHTDAGGIILLLQDEEVPGLEFLKDGEWVKIPPSKNNTIFVNTGDQVEVLSNGRYPSALHRVMTEKKGCRVSIATFYNPAEDAIISPAAELLYPSCYKFKDYLKLYATTKFSDKTARFNLMKEMEKDCK